jgi:hypothetical protein
MSSSPRRGGWVRARLAAAMLLCSCLVGAAPLYPDMPVNRWVPVSHSCRGGLKTFANGCPSERGWLQLAYDSKRQNVVLFGGSGEWYFNDLWYFSPATRVWELVLQDSELSGRETDPAQYPKGRDNHQMVYDPEHDVHWMYGGTGGGGFWKFTPTTNKWHKLPGGHDGVQLPLALLDPGFAYSPDFGQILVYGGEKYSYTDETWLFDTRREKWTQIKSQPAPPPRAQTENALVYNSQARDFILFGGRGGNQIPFGDTWIFDPGALTWKDARPSPAPGARDGHIMVFDQKNAVAVLWGGRNEADTWVYDPKQNRWRELVSARGGYDASKSKLASAVYIPEADLTVFRDTHGQMYFLRLDLSKPFDQPAEGPISWKPK